MSAKTANATPARNKHCRNSASGKCDERKLDITHDELNRIREALKQEEFRKLFCDYIEEIQDPENRKIYEEEVKQFERERGVNVKFVNPEPGFVVKTSADGMRKCFINIAKCKEIGKPTSVATCNQQTGERGLKWSIPLAQGAPHDDIDNQKKRCDVYDVVFHPDALHLANRDGRFRRLLIETALDAVEREFKVKLDRANLKFPKIEFKGIARPTVIRTLATNATAEETEPHPLDHIFPAKPTADAGKPKVLPLKTEEQHQKPEFSIPKYSIKHRRDVDLAEYTNELDAKLNVTLPRELIVEIELPLLRTTADCQLDVTERTVYLLSERVGAKYRLNINLPYAVNDKEGSAKFDTDKRCLRITLPVVQPTSDKQRTMHESLLHLQREDSGVECGGAGSGDEVRSSENGASPTEELSDSLEELHLDQAQPENSDTMISESASPIKPLALPSTFLKSSVQYQFPTKFDCNVLDNVLSLVLHVRNVQHDSIGILQQAKNLHLQFISIGTGYYPTHYAFFIQLPADVSVQIEEADAEAWENNVVLNITLNTPGELIQTYLAGLDSNDLKEYNIQGQFNVKSCSSPRNIRGKKSATPPPSLSMSLSSSLDVSVERSESERSVEIEIKPNMEHGTSSAGATNTTEDEEHAATGSEQREHATKKLNKKQRKRNKKRRSYSESTYDDIKAMEQHTEAQISESKKVQVSTAGNASQSLMNSTSAMEMPLSQQQRKQRSFSECRDSFSATNTPTFKSILKRYSRYEPRPSISDSCSSIDDCSSSLCSSMDAGVASSLHFSQSFCGIPEENTANPPSLSESCKKTVTFSDNIKKRIFRLDSSIIGQRKKNQKRRDLKQRALERRLSEGDSADYEDHNNHHQNNNKAQFHKVPNKNNIKQNNNNKKNDKQDSVHHKTNGINGGSGDGNAEAKSHSMNKGHEENREHLESESSQDADNNKNTMIFDMDM